MSKIRAIDAAELTKRLLGLPNPNVDTLIDKASASGRESSILEYKASYRPQPGDGASLDACRWNIVRAIISMANASGGCILVGIGEDSQHNPVVGNWDPDGVLKRERANEGANLADHTLKVLFGNKPERTYEVEKNRIYRVGKVAMKAIRKLTKCVPCRSERLDCGVLALIVSPYRRGKDDEFKLLSVEKGLNLVSTFYVRDENAARTRSLMYPSEALDSYLLNRRIQKEEFGDILLKSGIRQSLTFGQKILVATGAVLTAAVASIFTYYGAAKDDQIKMSPPPKSHQKLIYPPPRKSLRLPGAVAGLKLPDGKGCVNVCWCPPGKSIQGSFSSDVYRVNDERPFLNVQTNGFWIGRAEITQDEWSAVMGTTPFVLALEHFAKKMKYEYSGSRWVMLDEELANVFAYDGEAAMYNVSWNEAKEFCDRLNRICYENGMLPDGYAVSLPTEAQWEYACRAGDTNIVYQANPHRSVTFEIENDECRDLEYIGWYQNNSYRWYDQNRGFDTLRFWGSTLPKPDKPRISGVRKAMWKEPNEWGLYDTIGNVCEWCSDWYGQYPSEATPVVNYAGPLTGDKKVLRGGSWLDKAFNCRAASRWALPCDEAHFTIGFRIAVVKVE